MALRRPQVPLAPALLLLCASILDLDVTGLVLAQVTGCGCSVTSPALVEKGGMSCALGFFSAELVKVLLPLKEVAHSMLHITLEQAS